eukprot:9985270-Alexandrium_andersonii.AAC.1
MGGRAAAAASDGGNSCGGKNRRPFQRSGMCMCVSIASTRSRHAEQQGVGCARTRAPQVPTASFASRHSTPVRPCTD